MASNTKLNPLFNNNQMKIGIIAMNCSHGSTITTAKNTWDMTWPQTEEVVAMADNAGFEVLLPVARWKGYGGATNFNNRTFETFNWAAAVSAITEYSCIFSTAHVPLIHPVAAAKQCSTIDHISRGRFAFNVVCGWFKNEFEMFDATWNEHEVRYEYATEWLNFVRKIWTTEGEFDFNGQWFQSKAVWSEPKPIQKPMPPVMNAGGSPAGQKFAATQADMNFVLLKERDLEGGTAQMKHLKGMAKNAGRDIQVWIHAYVVCRDTEKEARDYAEHYIVEKGDYIAVNNLLEIFGMQSETLPADVLNQFRRHFIGGHGGYPLIGTPEKIVEDMNDLIKMGIDGILLSWVDYKNECQHWIEKVMPLMEQAGQRAPKPVSI